MKKRPTIQMVADLAGVSRGTVDRVLNNRSHVRPEVYDRVMDALEKTGYLSPRQHHQQAMTVPQTAPITLGVLLPNWTGHFKSEIQRGISAFCSEFEDFQITILTEECQTDVPQETLHLIDRLVEKGAEGLSLCVPDTPTLKSKVNDLWKENIPVITFNSDLPDSDRLCFVGQNYYKSGRIAAELISKCVSNSTPILAAVGNLEFDGHRARLNGFLERMHELTFSDSQISTIETFNNYQITYKKVLDFIESHPDVGAVYMANRSVAGCTEAIKTAEKKGDIRVICHDVAESTKLLLLDGSVDFTITQDIFRQGYLPLNLLREYLQKGRLPETTDVSTSISIICSQNL